MQARAKRDWIFSLRWSIGLVSIVGILFLGAPLGGAFSWPDAPRHALNGAFILDMIRSLPWADPAGYAYDYYSKYPALTILFYPPLFSFFLAPFYALFGVSQETAILAMFMSHAAFALGSFHVARFWLPSIGAFSVAAALAVCPEIAFWGRQVMLEVPAFALLTWSAFFFIKHLHLKSVRPLYFSIALLVLAHYAKLSVAFMSLPYVLALFHVHGRALLKNRHAYIIVILAAAGLAPLVLMTAYFGQANVQSVAGIADSSVSRLSLDGWLWYARALPSQVGWPMLVAALAFVATSLVKRTHQIDRSASDNFLLSWFAIGYIFFSAIDLKDPRLDLFIFLPLAIWSGLAIYKWTPGNSRMASALVIGLAVATMTVTFLERPVAYVEGYRTPAAYVATHAPAHSTVLFSGYRDGAFIFAMREREDRNDLSVLRADKMLLQIAVRRELGVTQKDYSKTEIGDLLNSLGVYYVVAQPDFWTDLEQMARLQELLRSEQFTEVARFPLNANYPTLDKELVVYRNLGEVAPGPVSITNELPIIGRSITGTTSGGLPTSP